MPLENKLIEELVEEIKSLKESIISFDEQNEKLEKRIYWLTIIATILATIQIIPIIRNLL